MKRMNPAAFAAAVAVYLSASYISTLRWKMLVPYKTKTKRLFDMYMIGAFFNICMPGLIGGDAVKIFYLGREIKNKRGKAECRKLQTGENALAVASVFMDRYIGFAALMTIATITFPFGFEYLQNTPVKWLVPFVVTSFIAGSIVVFRFRIGGQINFISNVYDNFSLYKNQRAVIGRCFAYSLFIQVLSVLGVYILALGLSMNISFLSVFVFLPIIIVISFLPLSISGIGLREGAFVFLFGLTGVSEDMAMTLSLVWFFSIIAASLWGLVEYLRFKTVLGSDIK